MLQCFFLENLENQLNCMWWIEEWLSLILQHVRGQAWIYEEKDALGTATPPRLPVLPNAVAVTHCTVLPHKPGLPSVLCGLLPTLWNVQLSLSIYFKKTPLFQRIGLYRCVLLIYDVMSQLCYPGFIVNWVSWKWMMANINEFKDL